MFSAFVTVPPPGVLPPGDSLHVDVGFPFVLLAMLVVLVVIGGIAVARHRRVTPTPRAPVRALRELGDVATRRAA